MVDEDHKRFPYKVYQFVDIGGLYQMAKSLLHGIAILGR